MAIILAVELLILLTVNMALFDYAKIAPKMPTEYAETKKADTISSDDGELQVNSVKVKVPDDDYVSYSIAYSWAKGDKEYPSVPNAAIATYQKNNPEEAKTSGDKSSNSDMNTVKYEISLYKEDHYSKSEIPNGKTTDNWFAAWEENQSDGVVKKRVTHGNYKGFLVSSLDAENYAEDYRSYKFSFAISESKGMSIYTLEGVCYEPSEIDQFEKIMDTSADSISTTKR